MQLAKIEIKNTTFDFGEISMNDSVNFKFSILNKSKIPLIISKVGTSCGCTTTKYTKDSVSMNNSATLNMQFIPNQTGYTEKSVVVETNTNPPYNVFYIKGNVVE